jgi:hypothetical protein
MYRGSGDGISVAAYTGDRAVLLAFDLAADQVEGLAGFAVACTPSLSCPIRYSPLNRLRAHSDSKNRKEEHRDNNSGEKYYKAQRFVLGFPDCEYEGNNQDNDHQREEKIGIGPALCTVSEGLHRVAKGKGCSF